VLVLVSLAGGAAMASKLARRGKNPMTLLAALLLLGGISVAFSPFVFMIATNGFCVLDTSGTMLGYNSTLFGVGFITIGLPALILGMIFPFLMKVEEHFFTHAGSSIGRLSTLNMTGAILGSLLCGFVFLAHAGMWRTLQWTAALYITASIFMPIGWRKPGLVIRSVGVGALLLFFTLLSPVELRNTGWDPNAPPEHTLDVWETSDCTVSVVVNKLNDVAIKVNSHYRLGSTQAAPQEHYQGKIPLLAFPMTRSIFFIGVGTGISVGGALDPSFSSVNRVVACDLFPEVIAASKKYMTGAFEAEPGMAIDYTNGLFKDRRVNILAQDGRHYLMASGETFDMVNADLFLPYQSGAGSLYSKEHFEHVKASLNPGGVFVQWLPMYQLTDQEFGSIARTMLDVFGQVTVWRNNFIPGLEILALVGHRDATPIPACQTSDLASRRAEVAGKDPALLTKLDLTYTPETSLLFYCGNLTASKEFFSQYPVNTDDRPFIEYTSPLSMRKRVDGFIPTIVGPRYEALIDRLLAQCPPDRDPMLALRTPANRRLVVAGAELHRFWLAKAMEESQKANKAWSLYVREWTDQE
jgi:spermidine synthase